MEKFLNDKQIQHFINDGYIKIEHAFSSKLADEGRNILWKDTGCDPDDPATWKQPVIRLGGYAQEPFQKAANTPQLHAAFDQLVGKGRWIPRNSLGTFPIRFPSKEDAPDTGWHAEASFIGKDGSMRLNVHSEGRALLMLFLFSDVGPNDAPTRILSGSHMDVPSLLKPAGAYGLTFIELAQKFTQSSLERSQVLATGERGTVYLCHPFLIHAAQSHHGTEPRFMAQPPLLPAMPLEFNRTDEDYSPVEFAIKMGLGEFKD